MNVITKETAVEIAYTHREIENGTKLLEKILEDKKWHRGAVDIRDAFGRPRELQLGIPSGENATQLYGLSWDLARPVIEAHIGKMQAKLVELSAIARMEMDGLRPAEPISAKQRTPEPTPQAEESAPAS